ncbi:hypothetical protein ACFFHH_06580 [Cytobacillus solani]|uniref:Outer membrane protein assembly factor BamE n=1 Tax=Cytobacillus solani TaxID=1637975 RepID=A0A0Q3QQG5_9BACI|nr:hypothetical protein [Cytobacillus solani]KQL19966.1 hypothetical protein AN957_16265 [Cytobacillus solani]USK53210.1 hypothetical protein LIS82_16505 [Cytobacillus solani]
MKKFFYFIFGGYIVLYVLIYFGYSIYIHSLHPTFSGLSVSAILMPVGLLILLLLVLWKYTDIRHHREGRFACLIVTTLCFVLLIYCFTVIGRNENKANFSSERWLAKSDERVYMVDDLLSRTKLIGLSKEEVITLLGKPDDTEYFTDDNNIVYYLGNERGFISIDSEWLVIWFDVDETVFKYEIQTD